MTRIRIYSLAKVINDGRGSKRWGGTFGIVFGENKKCRVTLKYLFNFVVQVISKFFCSSSSMFSTVFIDISLIFVQLGLENFGKIMIHYLWEIRLRYQIFTIYIEIY